MAPVKLALPMLILPSVLATYQCSSSDGVSADRWNPSWGVSLGTGNSTGGCIWWISDDSTGALSNDGVNLGSAAASCAADWARRNCAHTCCRNGHAISPPSPPSSPPAPPSPPVSPLPPASPPAVPRPAPPNS
eukprot:2028125-Prymnesium_polylepis.1